MTPLSFHNILFVFFLTKNPCVGVSTYLNRFGRVAKYARVSLEMCAEMIVEDDPNGAVCRIVSIQIFEQRDELATPVTSLDPANDVAIMEIQCSQNRACSQTLVFMVACRGGMFTGHRRQVWRGIGNGL